MRPYKSDVKKQAETFKSVLIVDHLLIAMVTTKKKTKKSYISREEALKAHFNRSKRARCKDEAETAKKVSIRPTGDWKKHPDRSDVLGIDAPTKIVPGHFKTTASGKKIWIGERLRSSKKRPSKCSGNYEYLSESTKKRGINPIYIDDEDE